MVPSSVLFTADPLPLGEIDSKVYLEIFCSRFYSFFSTKITICKPFKAPTTSSSNNYAKHIVLLNNSVLYLMLSKKEGWDVWLSR
jgi:hypothetical protein